MITNNFKAAVALLLQSNGINNTKGLLPVKTWGNITHYLGSKFYNFPRTIANNISFAYTTDGVLLGSGSTAPTAEDYKMDALITSGLSASTPTLNYEINDGNPQVALFYTLTNTTSSDIVIREVGYLQKFSTSTTLNGTDSATASLLLDRTLLDTPLTVPANGVAILKYQMKTIIS